MASIFDKFRISTAVEKRQKHVMDMQHITTGDFFHFQPVFIKEVVPDSDIEISAQVFSRMEALRRPTFGRADIKLRSFFVPYRTIFPAWEDFYSQSVHTNSNNSSYIVSKVPYFHAWTVTHSWFVETPEDVPALAERVTSGEYDFSIYGGGSDAANHVDYKFTSLGRLLYKIYNSLGYKLAASTGSESEYYNNVYISALPLLAYARIFIDWYYPSQYVGDDRYTYIMSILKRDVSADDYISGDDVIRLLYFCSICYYDSDYFTSAFDSPNGPDNGVPVSPVTIVDSQLTGKIGNISKVTSTYGTDIVLNGVGSSGQSSASSPYNVTQYILDSLSQLTKFFKRNQLAGARASDRLKARFGIDVSDPNRSHYLGHSYVPLQIGDVFSTSDTSGASLGDFAGRGYGAGQDSFKCKTGKDFGVVIVISTIVPRVGYYQGLSRDVLSLSPMDFFQPEFDGLGAQAIAKSELFLGNDYNAMPRSSSMYMMNNEIFGFTPRYAHLKTMLDKVTGDFSCNSVNTGMESWHLMRDIQSLGDFSYPGGDLAFAGNLVHSRDFIRGVSAEWWSADDKSFSQYDRIFSNPTGADHFNMFYAFKLDMWSPMKSLYDVYEFHDDEHNQKTDVRLNGGNMN